MSSRPLQATDREFALVSARAAIEVDNLLLGRNTGVENVRRLTDTLASAAAASASAASAGGFDAATVGVLGQAVKASCSVQSSTIADFVREANSIARTLDLHTTLGKSDGLPKLREFFVALSKAAASVITSTDERMDGLARG